MTMAGSVGSIQSCFALHKSLTRLKPSVSLTIKHNRNVLIVQSTLSL